MNLYDEFFALVAELDALKIPYAVVGGIALSFHAEPRYTRDIDILLTPEELDAMRDVLSKLGFTVEAESCAFKNTKITLHRLTKFEDQEFLTIDLLVGHDERHMEIVKNAIRESTDHGEVKIATKEDLIWLKRIRSSPQDLADIDKLENEQN